MCLPRSPAPASRAPQGRLKSPISKNQEWPLYTKFRDHGFLLTLERACKAQMWKGILRFRVVKSSKNFWPAGAAPQGRRGRGASRPARPGWGDFCYNDSNGRLHRKSALSHRSRLWTAVTAFSIPRALPWPSFAPETPHPPWLALAPGPARAWEPFANWRIFRCFAFSDARRDFASTVVRSRSLALADRSPDRRASPVRLAHTAPH